MGKKQIKRNCGLKDIYVAEVLTNTESAYETDTPYKLARALSAKITDKYNTETLYSDDAVEEVIEQFAETDIEIGVNTLSNEDYSKLYNTLYDNGFLVKSQEDQAKEVALGYRVKRTDGTYDFVWNYAGKFTERPEESLETQGEKINTQTATLKGVFYARQKADTINSVEKHLTSIKVNECELLESNTEAKEVIKDWFGEVQEYKTHSEVTA